MMSSGPLIMRATRFRIDIDADNFDAVNFHALRSRGQTSTRIDADDPARDHHREPASE